jgi:Transglycosylase-like domain
MRKLTLVPILSLIAVPAVAAPAGSAAGEPTGAELVSGRLGEPFVGARAWHRRQAAVRRRKLAARQQAAVAVPPHLEAIAQCESGGDPTAIGGGGLYRGKYQFSVATWQGVGGTGDPAAAPEAEQDRRAIMLYQRSGPGQWPVCGS